ncbi:MAG TPA: 2-oxo acid dehydrogenase subunit E2 [Acidimicrobiales bacterium]|nr:2-oxo acid dehydrogenase subunit E2 [Acidimicrobiales bacterium]
MPQLGETVAEGTVTKWFKDVGETLDKGEALFEVSTDKVDTEIPAPVGGTLTAILVPAGQTVEVGATLALIDEDPDGAAGTAPATRLGAEDDSGTRADEPRAPRTTRVPGVVDGGAARLSPVVRRLLAERHLEPGDVVGTGPGGRITREDVLAHVTPASTSTADESTTVSPVVRRLLREHGLRLGDVTGTGPGGRVQRRDVEAAAAGRSTESRGDEVVAFSTIRRLTAEHMVRSKATSAHTLMVREVDYENVERARRRYGSSFKEREGYSLTYLPFNAVAAVRALGEFPHLNASVGDDALVVHATVNLGIAVDLDGQGLVVPVVRDAASLSLREMAQRVRTLATGARSKRLTLDDMTHGTFTITNPGPYGTLLTGAIINQPQVAILATDGVSRKPVVVAGPDGEELIAIHSIGLVALTFDHRVIDGAYAARFLARLAEILQTRDWSSEL